VRGSTLLATHPQCNCVSCAFLLLREVDEGRSRTPDDNRVSFSEEDSSRWKKCWQVDRYFSRPRHRTFLCADAVGGI
jgi:hypothetical protein